MLLDIAPHEKAFMGVDARIHESHIRLSAVRVPFGVINASVQ